jgi:hypothetical protein
MEEDEGLSAPSVSTPPPKLTSDSLRVVYPIQALSPLALLVPQFFHMFRSLVQIKSHAQKVLKRIESGENVFRRLEENSLRTDALVAEIHADLGIAFGKADETTTSFSTYKNAAVLPLLGLVVVVDKKTKKQQLAKKREQQRATPEDHRVESKHPLPQNEPQPPRKRQRHTAVDYSYIVAASALCELSRPTATAAAAATPSSSNSSSGSSSSRGSTSSNNTATRDFLNLGL